MERPELRWEGYTWQQAHLIKNYDRMGKLLAAELPQSPELTDELSHLLHRTPLSYEGVIKHHFLESNRDIASVVQGPFVRAFLTTDQCTDEEAAFIGQLRELALTGQLDERATDGYRKWVDSRSGFIAKGFQRFVLDAGVIPPLTPEEINWKSHEAERLDREANPEKYADIQRRAAQAAAEAAAPIVFTDEVREQVQRWYDKGHDYETVTELLKGIGVTTTPGGLREATSSYDDLHYTLTEIRKQAYQGFLRAAREIFDLSKSRKKTVTILEHLGYSRAKTEDVLNKLKLRERIDWTASVDIGGQQTSLENIVLDFITRGFPTIIDEWRAFQQYLSENGIDRNIAQSSYCAARARILAKTNPAS